MQYNIKGDGVPISPEVRAYVETRLSHLDRFVKDLAAARCDAELEFSSVFDGPRYGVVLTFHEPGLAEALRAEERGTTLHEAIDIAAAGLFREMTRVKKRRFDRARRTAARAKEFLRGLRDRF